MSEDILINIDDPEVIITEEYSVDYHLPVASATVLGGVKIGENIDITDDGTISVEFPSIGYASVNTAGIVKVGNILFIDDNEILYRVVRKSDPDGFIDGKPTAALFIDANGVLSAAGSSTITVDNVLSTTSANPVQNKVITNTVNPIASDVAALQEDISTINGQIGDLGENIGSLASDVSANNDAIIALQGDVSDNADAIATNVTNIGQNTSDISDLDTRLTTDEGYITDQGNALSQLQGNVDPVLVTFSETADGTDIDNTIWTGGAVTIIRRGKTGVIKLTLEGSYTLQDASSKLVYTMSDQDNLPTFVSNGCLYTDDGAVYAEFDTDGKLTIYNYGSQAITLSYLMGSIPVIFI